MDPHSNSMPENNEDGSFGVASLRGKLMFAAIVVMFAGILVIICIHLYARCYLLRSRRRQHLRRGTRLVFYIDPTPSTLIPRGLESTVLNSLPVFVYSREKHTHLPECAVCLSEFEENERGRLLPKCNHGFHVDCIDMWFHSNSTCPLCRSLVEPVEDDKEIPELEFAEPGPSERRKELVIEIPNRGSMENELGGQSSTAISQGFISPVTRFLTFTSMLNMNRRSAGTTPSGSGLETTSDETYVPDIEKALEESNQNHNQNQRRAQTPK